MAKKSKFENAKGSIIVSRHSQIHKFWSQKNISINVNTPKLGFKYPGIFAQVHKYKSTLGT